MQDYSGYGQPPMGEYGTTAPLPPMPPRPPRRRIGLLSYVAVALAAGALGAGSVVALYHPSSNASAAPQPSSSGVAPAPLPSSAIPAPSSGGTTNGSESAIMSKVQPGLVVIETTLQYRDEEAMGTGMVINSTGLVLTNNHVIEDSTSIKATDLGNGQTYTAKVVGYDETGDIALIQLQNASGLRTVPIGDSATVKSGAAVVAMGNAGGEGNIVPAKGTVTALNQTITASDAGGSINSETLHGMIETNADIVSGDSGGPLANSAGKVIGIDTAGSGEGFSVQQSTAGFAIPIDTALSIAHQIGSDQASSTITIGYPPFMGIYIATSTSSSPQAQLQQEEGGYGGYGGNGYGGYGGFGGGNGAQSCYTSNYGLIPPSTIASVSSGTLIVGIICDGPAAAAGITAGSVITAVNGQAIGSPEDLTSVVSKCRPGTTISVTWVSPSGQRSTSNLHLTAGPPL
jgi:S1-C subfamily serine protease